MWSVPKHCVEHVSTRPPVTHSSPVRPLSPTHLVCKHLPLRLNAGKSVLSLGSELARHSPATSPCFANRKMLLYETMTI